MLAGPLFGNILIWFLTLWIRKPDDTPQTTTHHPPPRRNNGPERIPIRRKKPGTALSDFVKAMREEDVKPPPPRTALILTPGIPTRIRIPSPQTIVHTPLFPLSAPLSAETVMTPRNPHVPTFPGQKNQPIDTTPSKSQSPNHAPNLPFPPFEIEDQEAKGYISTSSNGKPSPPPSTDLIDEANKIPLPTSPIIQEKIHSHTPNATTPPSTSQNAISHPASSRRVRFTPRVRVVSTGTQLFPVEEEDPLSLGVVTVDNGDD